MISPGEEKAWEILKDLDPTVVCRNASAKFDDQGKNYIVRSFCYDYVINPGEKIINSTSPQGELIVKKFGYFFIHACLWYLIHAKDIPLTGKLVKPGNLKGGDLFFRGSHVLPLENVAEKFGDDKKAFLQKGEELCAEALHYGDASLKFSPMPRIPVIITLWLKDEEFPPGADLLFDSSCALQLPIDIAWSIAMLSLLVMI